MKIKIAQTDGQLLLVGGGEINPEALRAALDRCDLVVAADGGAARLLDLGVVPDAVIGDMDSLAPALQAQLPPGVLHPIAEQDSTDFDKCLRNIRAPLIEAHGFLGARVDHQLAVMSVLARRPDSRCLLVGSHDVIALVPPQLALEAEAGQRVSLYPMTSVQGRSTGLRWEIDGLDLAPTGIISTSNEATGPVSLTMTSPGLLIILPVTCRAALAQGLRAAPSWPSHA
ncbi:MAG: thiamine diphosphokinase [Pelagimonas sp.]|jgi:thiamine pyrophosphokinase|nr:thiamine diphosphokinase [Pelagimonas sp.]